MSKTYGFIVEGTHDADKVERLFPNARCVVTNGTRFKNRTKMDIDDLIHSTSETFVLTDPDEAGDLLARRIMNHYSYFKLRRIALEPEHCTEQKMTPKGKPYLKIGVENADDDYLMHTISMYLEGGELEHDVRSHRIDI